MQLMPSANTLAMRPIWFLEDLYVDVSARGQDIATALLSNAEELPAAPASSDLPWQPPMTIWRPSIPLISYKKMGYVREEHFLYFHRLLP
jgi:GNAT superfamily N-acetyltransferase